jgi:hypothetical protein
MSRQEVDIGIVGNDGTGDSIREAFRKVNENFKEIYSVFNQGDTISFQDLGNVTVNNYNTIVTTVDTGDGIRIIDRVLDGGNSISVEFEEDKISIRAIGTSLDSDESPTLAGPLKGNGYPIAKISEPSQQAINVYNTIHPDDPITINDFAITKGWADKNYLRKSGGSSSVSGQIRVRDEPLTNNSYILEVDGNLNNNILVNGHGFDSAFDGASFIYETGGVPAANLARIVSVTDSTHFIIGRTFRIQTLGNVDYTTMGALRNKVGEIFTLTNTGNIAGYGSVMDLEGGDPSSIATSIIDGGSPSTTVFTETYNGGAPTIVSGGSTGTVRPVYFLKYVSSNELSIHPTFSDAQGGANKISYSGGTGFQLFIDAYYDSTLEGNWLSNEVLPRKSTVRRQGDKMEGALILHDHPFPLEGAGTPNRPDDLQAATKYYVDNSSFASQVNLYVSNDGNDSQLDTPPGKEGRAWAYAFNSVGKACEVAEYMMLNASLEPGPYRQLVSYSRIVNGITETDFSVVTSFTPSGLTGLSRVKFSNNNGGPVDQGSSPTIEIIPGKLLKGRISGATGIIYSYTTDNSSSIGEDYVDLQQVKGTFLLGENIEFGDPVKNLHITIHIESGTYEEDYPIKLPENTAIVGDEFRRVIIRPKDRISRSPWVYTWFFRNSSFDDLNIAKGNVANFNAELSGYYGYHYLKDPTKLVNRGTNYTNAGNYISEANTITTNKIIIQNAVKNYINALGVLLTPIEEAKCIRDIGYILDAIIYDLKNGSINKIFDMQEIFSSVTLSANCMQGLSYISDYINTTILASSNTTIKNLITNMIQKIIFGFNINYNTPKHNKDIDVFLCNDATIVRQVTCQGHGGFMMVLDPYGQVLTKSPYCQQSGSFSGSINTKSFRGGQYIDGFAGNLTPTISEKISDTSLKVSGIPREPKMPTSFFIDGGRYKVDSWIPEDGSDINARDLLLENNLFIQIQTLTYLAATFNSIKYPEADVNRHINRIINAITFDVTVGGNSKSLEATRRLFHSDTELFIYNDNLKPMVLGMLEYIKETAAAVIVNQTVTSNQNQITQVKIPTRSGTFGSQSKIADLINNIKLTVTNGLDSASNLVNPTFVLKLDPDTPILSSPVKINLITPGNTSMLSNDYTQVNDLGYGIVTNNNGLAECVSVFSYYCWTGMFSNNGGQIRSLNSSTANGEYGLVASGSDPLEIADQVSLVDNTVQVARIVKRNTGNNDLSNTGLEKALFVYIDNFEFLPYNVSILEVNHGPTIGFVRYEINNISVIERDGVDNPTIIKLNFNTSGNNDTSTGGLSAAVNDGDKIIIRSGQNFKFSNVLDTNPVRPSTALTFEGDPANDINAPVYRVISYNIKDPDNKELNPTLTNSGLYASQANLINSQQTSIKNAVVGYINSISSIPLDTDEETKSKRDTGYILDALIYDLTYGGVTKILDVTKDINSASLEEKCKLGILYIATYINTNILSGQTALNDTITKLIYKVYIGDQAILTFDSTYNYIPLIVNNSKLSIPNPDGGTHGYTVGDTRIAIKLITSVLSINRINTGQMIFGWDGKIHRIVSYTPVTAENYGYIIISDLDINGSSLRNINTPVITGLQSSLDPAVNTTLNSANDQILRAGLAKGELGNITVRISTMRATGHDFLDVGTGGYNTSNYPSKIYGAPKNPSQAREVEERTRGRVFYVSTDQDGFFRVGRFFTVDQGTGTVTFAASIALSNLDGIGFKRGISVSEFSSDDRFNDLAEDAVPTEAAISGYIDRRLGFDREGNILASSETFPNAPGYIARNANTPLKGPTSNISWANYRLIDLGAPVAINDAATKNYVDLEISQYSNLKQLRDVLTTISSPAEVLMFASTTGEAVSSSIGGDLIGSIDSSIKSTLTEAIAISGGVASIDIDDASNFPNSGYVLIGEEIFSYNGRTTGNGAEQLDGVTRLSIQTDDSSKFTGLDSYAHSVGATVYSLTTAELNLQIKPNTITNTDVNIDAGISQNKLSLNLATTLSTSPTGTAADKQANSGLSSFDSANFNVVDGWVKVKDGGIARIEQENISGNKILGNLNIAATYPQEVNPEDILKRATWDSINASSTIQRDHVFTFRPSATEATSTFSSTEINANVTANSIAKRTATGNLKITNLDSNGNVSIISISGTVILGAVTYAGNGIFNCNATTLVVGGRINVNGINAGDLVLPGYSSSGTNYYIIDTNGTTQFTLSSTLGGVPITTTGTTISGLSFINATGTEDNSTPIIYKGQWSPGNAATFRATTADSWTNSRSITITGDATGTTLFNGSANATLNLSVGYATNAGTASATTGSVTFNNSGLGDVSGTQFNGSNNRIISYNSIGSPKTDGTGATGTWPININGNAATSTTAGSTSVVTSGGSVTTTIITAGTALTQGSIEGAWVLTAGSKLQATYADLAEWYIADKPYAPGDVLVFGGIDEVTTTKEFCDHRVAGVVTTNPAYVMNDGIKDVTNAVCIALQGRVPCRVIGAVRKGDLLVTSTLEGYAVRGFAPSTGTVIGKALENKETTQPGIIEIAVGRC